MIILVELGAIFWVGASIFQIFVFQPVRKRVPEEEETLVQAQRRYRVRIAPFLHLVLLLAHSGVLLGQAFVLSSGQWTRAFAPSLLFDLITSGSFGRSWLFREVVLLLALRLALYSVQTRHRPQRLDVRLPWFHLLLGLAFFGALTMSGHASAVGQKTLPFTLLANWFHLGASAFWIGGMLFLALVVLPLLSSTPLMSRVRFLLLVLRAYSPWAIAGVLFMALTGPFLATVRIGGWEQFLTTVYGRVLGVKILLVGGLLLTSAWHVFWLRPRLGQVYRRSLERHTNSGAEALPLPAQHGTTSIAVQQRPGLTNQQREGERQLTAQTRRLMRVLQWEPLLGIGVLICVGFLNVFGGTIGITPTFAPSISTVRPATGAFETTVKTTDGKFAILFTVTPATVGANEFTVKVQDHRSSGEALGGQLLREGGVSLYLSYTGEVGARTVNLQPDGKGRFGATEDLLLAGKWSVRIQVRTVERTLHEAKVSLQVAP